MNYPYKRIVMIKKVIEISGNISSNSKIIATLLEDKTNLVTIECDDIICYLFSTK